MASNLNYKQAANVERRTWDREKYEAKAIARAAADEQKETTTDGGRSITPQIGVEENDDGVVVLKKPANGEEPIKQEFIPADAGRAGPAKSRRAFLKARSSKVDLDSKVGTTEIVAPEQCAAVSSGPSITDGVVKSSNGVGWHCRVCDCFLKDSLTYLDHINGRKHQRTLGYTMRSEKVTVSQVKAKMAALAESQEAKKRKITSKRKRVVGDGAAQKILQEDEDERFSNSTLEATVRAKDEEALRRKAERARKRDERRRRAEEEEAEESGIDPDMAAMMGFGGFGGGNKNR